MVVVILKISKCSGNRHITRTDLGNRSLAVTAVCPHTLDTLQITMCLLPVRTPKTI